LLELILLKMLGEGALVRQPGKKGCETNRVTARKVKKAAA
jgi:hypothetical protein